MGRPRLTEQRGEQILDAFIALVGERGLHATTLDDVAAAVDLRRGTVRHFVGNREQLIVSAIDRLVIRYETAFRAAVDDAPGCGGGGDGGGCGDGDRCAVDRLIDRLFAPDEVMETENRAFVALMNAGDDPAVRASIARAYERYLQLVSDVLAQGSDASADVRRDLALAIVSLAETARLLHELDVDDDALGRAARTARALVRPLREVPR